MLLLDAGNTRLKYQIRNSQGEVAEFGTWLYEELDYHPASDFDEILVSAVNLPEPLAKWLEGAGTPPYHADTGAKFKSLVNSYEDPSHMGVDRWLAMVAAVELYPNQILLLIDAGTALTTEVIDANGQHLGGFIVPGQTMAKTALYGGTEQVHPRGEAENDSVDLGKNTLACVEHGIRYQAIAMCGALVERFMPDQVIVTGGNGAEIVNNLEGFSEQTNVLLAPDLVLQGLIHWKAWQEHNK